MTQAPHYNPPADGEAPLDEEDVFVFPASFAQQRLWFLDQFEPNSPFYNIPTAVRLSGQLDATALERALNEIVVRHETLRTTFASEEGKPVQVIHPEWQLTLALTDLSALPPAEREAEALRLANDEARTPFNLATGPLIRARLLRLDAREHIVLLTLHHIISDGWSMSVLVGEVATLYDAFTNGRPSPLPELPIQYADFAEWQRSWLQGEVLERQLSYWRTALTGPGGNPPPVLDLPTDRPRPAVQSSRGASLSARLAKPLADQLRDLSRREGTTLFMALLSVFQVLLHRYSGQDDICVGTPIANRTRAEIEPLIGFFVNTLVLRGDLRGNPGFRELLRRTREAAVGAYAHQDLPFEMLVEAIQPERDMSHNPLFQVMFILQNTPVRTHRLTSMTMEQIEQDTGTSTFDLTLMATEQADGLDLEVEYCTDLFEAATIQRMLSHLQVLIAAIVTHPDARIGDLALLTPAERATLLDDWGRQPAPAHPGCCVHALVAAHAARTPAALAVVAGEQRLSYAELDARASQLAHHLRSLGVQAETLVAIALEKSADLIVAVLATHRAGGAYVPIDPSYPAERIAHILHDARPAVVITRSTLCDCLPPHAACEVLLDRDAAAIGTWPTLAPDDAATPGQLAYVIYTSGSTGQPRGVMISHHSLVNQYLAWEQEYALSAQDVHLQMASFSFDVFAGDYVRALCSGATLVLCPRDLLLDPLQLAALIERAQITIAEFVPAVLRELMRHLEARNAGLTTMRLLACGSDSWFIGEYRRFARRLAPGTRLVNSFGVTEATIDSTYYEAPPEHLPADQLVPIGRPFPGTAIHILDRYLQPVPAGVKGELCIGGPGLARGYLNRPELTAERFVELAPGQRIYRTGDVARWLPDGTIEFLGRLDHQVKIRGYRVEPGEIEALIARHSGVSGCAVVAHTDAPGGTRLAAYLVPADDGAGEALAGQVRRYAQDRLPEFMVPSAFMLLKRLPLTPNGKVDRSALPPPDWSQRAAEGTYVAPRTPAEELLAGIWAQVLGIQQAGAFDNFFELGGHSLLATRLVSRVRDQFATELPLRVIFEAPVLADLAERIEIARRSAAGTQAPPLVPVPRDGELPLSFAQQRLWFLDQLEPESPFYNIPETVRLSGMLDLAALERALNRIVERHEVLRSNVVTVDGRPQLRIHAARVIPVQITDVRHLPRAEREQQARQVAVAEARTPFRLAEGPLLRAHLVRLADDDQIALLTMHHIIGDEWSSNVLMRELSVLYEAFMRGQPDPLPELPIQYADFAAWQRNVLQGEHLERQLAYWREALAGIPPLIELPTDRPRPAVQSYTGSYRTFSLPAALALRIRALSAREGATLFMTLLAAFQTLLYRYSGQNDICVGTPIANRGRAEIEPLIGFFVNTLVLRARMAGVPDFCTLLAQVRENALGAYAHQDVPFEMIVDALQPERNLSHAPLFQVMFVIQNDATRRDASASGARPALDIDNVEVHSGTAKFDLTLFMIEEGDQLGGAFEYNTDLFDAATIDRMIGHFQTLLESITASPETPVDRLALISADERMTLLERWNATAAAYPRERCFHELFEAQVNATPAAIAVTHAGTQLSYAALNARANQLAHYLRAMGVGPDVLVAIYVERSVELLVALLGVLKSGGAYVPIDPTYPGERIMHMLADAQPAAVLTTRALHDQLPAQPATTVLLDADWPVIASQPSDNPAPCATPDNLAYVIFTSGSTGRPKGAMIEHRGLTNYLWWALHAYAVAAGDGAPVHSSIAFDLTITGLYTPLLAGKTVHMLPEYEGVETLGSWLRSAPTQSLVKITPAHLELLAQQIPAAAAAGRTRAFIIGGENLLAESLRFWLQHAPDTVLVNEYGPTETVVGCSVYTVRAGMAVSGSIPIGRPIANTQLYVLDTHLEPTPIGVIGELYIGGDGVGRGYLNRADLTAERFLPNPFVPGGRLYRTGDLARYRADGTLEFLGRIDHQVKLRGFRIELGEIEAVLGSHPAIRECAVLLREDTPGAKRLVAYVVSGDGGRTDRTTGADPSGPRSYGPSNLRSIIPELRTYLKERLPEYMVPAAFVTLARLPLTPNAKVDRTALPAPEYDRPDVAAAYVAPQSPAERLLAEIWASVLGLARVGVHDNFFELGGDSILSIQVIARANAAGLTLTPRQLFQAPTIAGLAAYATLASAERDYWLGLVDLALPPLPREHPAAVAGPQEQQVQRRLDAGLTRRLVEELPAAGYGQPETVLLAALAHTLAAWSGQTRMGVDLARPAPADLLPGAAPITCYPVVLTVPAGEPPEAAMAAARAAIERLPAHGLGYELLRQLAGDQEFAARIARLPQPEIALSYLGIRSSVGPADNTPPQRPYLLRLDAMVVEGIVHLTWQSTHYQQARLAQLADQCLATLETLIAAAGDTAGTGLDQADFAEFGWSQDDLDDLLSKL